MRVGGRREVVLGSTYSGRMKVLLSSSEGEGALYICMILYASQSHQMTKKQLPIIQKVLNLLIEAEARHPSRHEIMYIW